jgi:hypothetical protein
MNLEQLDSLRLRSDIQGLIADCSGLKTVLRARWTRPMADEQRRHARARRKLTALFILLAYARGRLHVRTAPREVRHAEADWDALSWNRRVAERIVSDYARPGTAHAEAR